MPRHAKPDKFKTGALRAGGFFRDKRSFMSVDEKLFLYGVDMSAQRKRVLERDEKCCVVCGKFVGNNGEADHFPVSRGRGGSDDMDNLRTSCGRCHTGQGGTHG
jgi:ribosomal protein S27AE